MAGRGRGARGKWFGCGAGVTPDERRSKVVACKQIRQRSDGILDASDVHQAGIRCFAVSMLSSPLTGL